MRLLAQHGFGEGDKINEGLRDGSISGVVYGAKDITPDRLRERIRDIHESWPEASLLFDPQFYVAMLGSNPNVRLGNLEKYSYFSTIRRGQLEGSNTIEEQIRNVLQFEANLPLTAIVTPNIVVSRSFDSVEAVIAKNFVRLARRGYAALNDPRPLYATLAMSREALTDKGELQAFLNDITLLDEKPDGFYLLIAGSSSEARAEFLNSDVLAAWMLLNYSLKVNGYHVINGYSDLMSPILGAVGGDFACTGWFNTLRSFSLERFAPTSTGGRQPIQRYLSTRLLNRITFIELNALRRAFPGIVNGLGRDALYDQPEPERNQEVLQSWEALAAILAKTSNRDVAENLAACGAALDDAEDLYAHIAMSGYPLDAKSSNQHLEPLRGAIELFKRLAEF
jgi:hypothetical protein